MAFGCANAEARREADPEIMSSVTAAVRAEDGSGNPAVKAALDDDDPSLRRSYGSNEMKVHACATRQDDGTLVGEGCPSGIVVFGPYVSAPANANVRLQFEIESPTQLHVMSDVLSSSAKQFHAALEDEVLQPNQPRTVSYRIHLFDSARALEARIGIRADEPSRFKISNLQLSVQ
jgi:hypothetical protein